MATVSRRMSATPHEVFLVLADGWSYANWVVGASRIREVEDNWPAAGSKIQHSVGAWPMLINDHTEVLSVDPDRELTLKARAWPAGEAHVRVVLEPEGDAGTLVTISEDAVAGPAVKIPEPVRNLTLVPRNREALWRLSLLAERRPHRPPGDA